MHELALAAAQAFSNDSHAKLLLALLFSAGAIALLLISMSVVNLCEKLRNWLKERQRKQTEHLMASIGAKLVEKHYGAVGEGPLRDDAGIIIVSNPTPDNWVKDHFKLLDLPPLALRKELFGEFVVDPLDQKADELVAEYYRETEAYDRSVCTGPIKDGSILPANAREYNTIVSYKRVKSHDMQTKACKLGISLDQMRTAIRRYAKNHP
jgi:hypothetical protein